jgi:hypothetical protein
MEILFFKTNIASPIGIQAIWDSLKTLGINHFVIDFFGIDKVLRVVSDQAISAKTVIETICGLGYHCEELSC